jgi:glycosyltransferase involved in cell wall biosynthesis
VWRRNQYLATELIRQGLASSVWFVEPLTRGRSGIGLRPGGPGVNVVAPRTPVPKSLGGLAVVGRRLRRHVLHDADLLWVNDPALGVHCLRPDVTTVYDVTDDWRTAGFPGRIARRISTAEDRLAVGARTIACSHELGDRWKQRYGLAVPVVNNGVDEAIWRHARPRELPGSGPHVGYVGTLHEHRLDLDLVERLARTDGIGSVHLVGPNCLGEAATRRLQRLPRLRLHGAVPAAEVPSWTLAMDVLVSPHLVNEFTLSLDAIKAYEYATSGRPVVATATSGFTSMPGRTTLADPAEFPQVVVQARRETRPIELLVADDVTWAHRAREFWGHAWTGMADVRAVADVINMTAASTAAEETAHA